MQQSRRKVTAAQLSVGDYICFSRRMVLEITESADRLHILTQNPRSGERRLHRWTRKTPVWLCVYDGR